MDKEQKVMISVIIPTHNSSQHIEETIRSILAQDFSDIEIIVVDDGSTDDTRTLIERFGGQVKYFYQQNQGSAFARNSGLDHAQGKYIFFMDADDLLAKEILGLCIKSLEANKSYKVVYGKRSSFIVGETINTTKFDRTALGSGNIFPLIVKGLTLTPGQFMIAREAIDEIGEFKGEMEAAEDWEFLLRLSCSYEFLFINRLFVYKRVHKTMKSFYKNRPDLYDLRCRLLKETFPDRADEIIRTYITPLTIADWHRSFGFSYGESGDRQMERRYLIKSLKVWPFQPKLWLWFILRWIPPEIKKQLKNTFIKG
ncbi:MAG: glycosyltransferase family 2 protein [Candidatus Omnitrophica bacterium]|nr:glycosyltransferase family 2 protein [Candidatus Omnitrophota bacterium]